MVDSLRTKTMRALVWSFAEAIGQQGTRFVIGIVLARLLLPEQFGLIGMLAIFMAVAQAFLSSGFGAALIQKKKISQLDICSVFYFNIIVGILATVILYTVSPWIAGFYKQPIITPIARALSLTIVINSLGLIQTVLLTRQIDFKTVTKVSLIASILSGIIGIAMAVNGFGVWSLVSQQISDCLIRTVSLWMLNDWRPSLIFSIGSLRTMFGFGSKILASGLLNQIFDNIYLLVIGKVFSPIDLGFYTRAKSLQELPSQTLAGVVGRVTFPVFSSIQDDPVRLKRGLRKALTTLVFINFPMMIGLAVVARPLVLVLLTDKWSQSIVYLQLLCGVGFMFPLHLINLNILQAMGRSDIFFRLEIIKKVLTVISILVTYRWGISVMIIGMVVTSAIGYFLNSYYSAAIVDYSLLEQLFDMSSYLITSISMGIAVYAIGLLPFSGNLFRISVLIPSGLIIYIIISRLLKLSAFMEIWNIVSEKISLFKSNFAG